MTQRRRVGQGMAMENTLRMSPRRLLGVLDYLDGRADGPEVEYALAEPNPQESGAKGRGYARGPYRALALPVVLHRPGATSTLMHLASRNLSATGVGLLHSAYVHVGTRCTLTLPTLDQRLTTVPGAVVRCQHRFGVLHEVGVRFNQMIDVREYLRVRPMSEWTAHESVDPEGLTGTVLHVEASEEVRQDLRRALAPTGLMVRSIESFDRALSAVEKGAEVLIAGTGPGQVDVARLLTALGVRRPKPQENGPGPGVILTGDPDDTSLSGLCLHPAVRGFCGLPLSGQQLLRTLADALEPFRSPAAVPVRRRKAG